MNDLNEMTETPISAMSPAGVGHLLGEARENAGLTLDEVATQLRLSPRQVAAIEAGDVDALPGPAFVRGFVRNYAKLLQLDAEPLLECYKSHIAGASQSHISLHSENILIAGRSKKAWVPYLLAVLLLIVALIGWLVYNGDAKILSNVPEQVTVAPLQQGQTLPTLQSLPLPSSEPQSEVVAPESLASVDPDMSVAGEEAGMASPPAAPAAEAVSGQATLLLEFSATSWVSVRNRDGVEIYNNTLSAGSRETIQGEPPLRVTLGNASGIKATYNGTVVDLAPHTQLNVARLTLQ